MKTLKIFVAFQAILAAIASFFFFDETLSNPTQPVKSSWYVISYVFLFFVVFDLVWYFLLKRFTKGPLMVIFALMCSESFAQKIQLQGGAWVGANKETVFLGLVGPKISIKKGIFELGVTGIPGYFTGAKGRLGLTVGPTFTIKVGKQVKLVTGCMFYKTSVWYGLPGVGITF